jgi:hypothetical protein
LENMPIAMHGVTGMALIKGPHSSHQRRYRTGRQQWLDDPSDV